MGKYKKGTQAMLDAARHDSTLLPFDTVFWHEGVKIKRMRWLHDNAGSVYFVGVKDTDQMDCKFGMYLESSDILPAKKSKPKKWQNGTQSQLDAAKADARLIPKKTYFKSMAYGMEGMVCYRADYHQNDSASVLMVQLDDSVDGPACHAFCHSAYELEPINV